jgi:hypothetical protein
MIRGEDRPAPAHGDGGGSGLFRPSWPPGDAA